LSFFKSDLAGYSIQRSFFAVSSSGATVLNCQKASAVEAGLHKELLEEDKLKPIK
jgi:hypothetical protein